PNKYFEHVARECHENGADYLDGTIFGGAEMYATPADFRDSAPRLSDYTYMSIYYRSIRQKREDWLTAKDYIWRWDADWFWCSKHFYVQNPAVRLVSKWALRSAVYQRIMRLSSQVMPD